MKLPFDIGPIHIVGIGGIGMSGIAEVLHNLGYTVQGSDIARGANVRRLQGFGVTVHIGHAAENISGASVVVISSAVKEDNAEVLAARDQKIPVVSRAHMLAELMRLKWCVSVGGTHGKTTTTSIVASLFDAANYDPTVINGGIINAYGTNARLGEGEWMIVEADESDGTFVKLPSTVAIVTNIDPEHLDFYGDFDAERAAFQEFVQNVPFYGFAVLCIDHPEVQRLVGQVSECRVITYGLSPQANVRGMNAYYKDGLTHFDVEVRFQDHDFAYRDMTFPMPGTHNMLNAIAGIAVAIEMGFEESAIREALSSFAGVGRRFTRVGEAAGVSIIDDYAHHPEEILAVLNAARDVTDGRIIAVVQPHRYSRLRDLFEEFATCFNDADIVLVSAVYAAGEMPLEGYDRDHLVQALKDHGHRQVVAFEGEDELPGLIADIAEAGDTVLCMGAGSISAWANALPGALQQIGSADSRSAEGGGQ